MTAPTAFRWRLLAIATAVLTGCFRGSAAAPPLDAASFQEAYDRLGTMIEQAQAEDADAAEEEYLQAQENTQRISEALEELPAAVIIRSQMLDVALPTRQELAEWRRADFLAAHAERLRGILIDAAIALSFDPPLGN